MVSHYGLVKTFVIHSILLAFQIDCSHGNSQKQHKKQLDVVNDIVRRLPLLPVTTIYTIG